MIYTIGYGNRKLAWIEEIIARYDIEVIIDVRTSPHSRFNPEFHMKYLSSALGEKYQWWGTTLGGKGPVIENTALRDLVAFAQNRRIAVMCSESDYHKCHRHTEIARRLFQDFGVPVTHILPNGETKTMDAELKEQHFGTNESEET